jgi:hypothetical protein
MASWQTSLIGIVLILLGGIGIKWGGLDPITGGAIITAGLGFLRAKDSNVTGGSVPQASPPGVALKSNAMGVVAAIDALPAPSPNEELAKKIAEAVVVAPPMTPVEAVKKDCR